MLLPDRVATTLPSWMSPPRCCNRAEQDMDVAKGPCFSTSRWRNMLLNSSYLFQEYVRGSGGRLLQLTAKA